MTTAAALAPARTSSPRTGPVRVAVIGCGAIARDFHLPVLAGHAGVRLAALVDRDTARAGELARAYGASVLPDASRLDPAEVDAALIATPPAHHAPCAIELARRGIHVLVEKPMALTLADARAMVEAARQSGVVLAVGLFRRLYPSMRLLRGLLASRMLGRPVSFDIEAGSPYGWPLTTLANMRRESGGGGVFIDIAPHTLDQLLFTLPGELELLEYRDNSLGGIESDCQLRFRIRHDGAAIDGRMELSRTRKLRNTIRIDCERGSFELSSGERFRVNVRPNGLELADAVLDRPRPYTLQAAWADQPEAPGFAAYREQIDDWLAAIRTSNPPQLSGESALPVVGFIEECYRAAGRMPEPWVTHGLTRVAAGEAGRAPAEPRAPGRRVLVTGATGFIGCRVAEMLSLRDGWDVRGLVRNPANASRLARLPVEMVLGDLHSPEQLAAAVRGCDAVVHCAIGTEYGRRRAIFEVTVEGTRRLAEAARAAGVRRFVHISTAAVHGRGVTGTLDESAPLRPSRGDDYAESKAAAEHAVRREAARGLSAIILRPTNVYGPFASTLIVRPLQKLAQGALAVVGGAERPANAVYVDNVAEAIARALEAPAGAADGEAFLVSDGDGLTWADFFGFFAAGLGLPGPATPEEAMRQQEPRRWPWLLRWPADWARGAGEILTSAELKGLARKALQTDPIGTLPRSLLENCPGLERGLRKLLRMDRPLTYVPPAPDAAAAPMVMNPIAARASVEKARRVLGYAPAVEPTRARELTLEWVRHARLV